MYVCGWFFWVFLAPPWLEAKKLSGVYIPFNNELVISKVVSTWDAYFIDYVFLIDSNEQKKIRKHCELKGVILSNQALDWIYKKYDSIDFSRSSTYYRPCKLFGLRKEKPWKNGAWEIYLTNNHIVFRFSSLGGLYGKVDVKKGGEHRF